MIYSYTYVNIRNKNIKIYIIKLAFIQIYYTKKK